MNHRERELAAIRHQIPDRVPVDAIAVENTSAVAATLGVTEESVPELLGLDGRVVGLAYAIQAQDAGSVARHDEWGAIVGDVYGKSHDYPLANASSSSDVVHHPWPDPSLYDYGGAAMLARGYAGDHAVRGPYWQPLFCRICSLAGMENALTWMISEPALFESVLDGVFERTQAICETFVDKCASSLDIFYLGDDFASQRGMLFEPDLWRKHLKPRYAKLFEIGKAAGKHVWFHSCGDITPVLPDLIDIGMDVWETVQLHALPVTPQDLKREYGRHVTFFGGINTQQLPFTTPGDVADEVRRCIDLLGEGGGFICGPDHHVKLDVPPENTIALFTTAREYQRAGFTSGAKPA